mmetsp:Transcript_21082/g.46400  ORF Transcript_21082/g.46400 Transcript_21082/m.46400 type:complete len:236 (-) Transcript_21082:82-789(-)
MQGRRSLLGSLEHGFQLLLPLSIHLLQNFYLFLVLPLFLLTSLCLMLLNLSDLVLQFLDLISKLLVGHLQILHLLVVLVAALLCLQCLAHSKCDGRLVEALIRANRHPDFISDSQQQQSTFRTNDGDLSDEFIEALRIQFLTDGTNASLTSLSLLQPFVKVLLQVHNICTCGWCARYILHPKLILLSPFSWWKNGIQDVLRLRHRRLGIFFSVLVFFTFRSARGADQNGSVVLHQ